MATTGNILEILKGVKEGDRFVATGGHRRLQGTVVEFSNNGISVRESDYHMAKVGEWLPFMPSVMEATWERYREKVQGNKVLELLAKGSKVQPVGSDYVYFIADAKIQYRTEDGQAFRTSNELDFFLRQDFYIVEEA